ncbi:toMV susceptible protein tm-2-like [Actinidia eriantha]|uniref:toMV susceptible protein tm-2-like n=1 Tax=Actinidia eriantha TaxID=165200 RepID=UPI00258575D5|nr:toMV susceptible protein tm-2-like [Actinidia eriantha]
MADIVLLVVIQKAVDIASDLAMEEDSRFSRLKANINWIQSEMRYIQSYLEDIDSMQAGDKRVATLISDIRSLGLDVEDILDKYSIEIASAKRKGFFTRLRTASGIFGYIYNTHNFVAEIGGIKEKVNDINRRRQTYGIQERYSGGKEGTHNARRSFPHLDEPNIVGFEEHIKHLVVRMLDKDSQSGVISITGMAGLGKTTLAKKVYNSSKQCFECSAWICVSQQPNMAELLRDIARQVGLEKKKWEHDVEANLFAFLCHKRYVIVIDDIWEMKHWDTLKTGIPYNFDNGSRILLTSRNRDVGVHIGGQTSLFELQPLDLENSRNLFFKMARGSAEIMKEASCDPPQLQNIGEQILRRCGGVPLAIVLVASMLSHRERTVHAWERVLGSIGGEEDQCLKIFTLSYKDLPTTLKPCFLYFGLFPEDYEIHAFDIINMWAGEGFVRDSGEQEAEDVGEDFLNQLIARNLIQVGRRKFDGRIKSVHIHDILHGLCVRVAKETSFFITINNEVTRNSDIQVRRVTSHCSNLGDRTVNYFRTAKLYAVLCFGEDDWSKLKRKHVKKYLRESKYLRVLSLNCRGLYIALPSEIGNLRHLSYVRLSVQGAAYVDLPTTISNLENLVTLDMRGCYRVVISHIIWNMKKLKHILLPEFCEIKFDSRGMLRNMVKVLHSTEATSVNLQTLCGLAVQCFPDNYLFPKFANLKKLGFSFGSGSNLLKAKVLLDSIIVPHKLEILRLYYLPHHAFNIMDLNLHRYENLFTLHLYGPMTELPAYDKLPQNLTKLTLVSTCLEADPMDTLRKLPKLKILQFDFESYIGEKMMVCFGGGPNNFPQLQVLDITGLYNLKELLVEKEGMPQLTKLRMENRNLVMKIPSRIHDITEKVEVGYTHRKRLRLLWSARLAYSLHRNCRRQCSGH